MNFRLACSFFLYHLLAVYNAKHISKCLFVFTQYSYLFSKARMKDAAPWISSMMYNFPQAGYIQHMPYQLRAMTSQAMTADDQSMTRSVGVAGSSSVTVNQDDSGSHVTSTSGGGNAVTSKGDDSSSQMISNDNSFANARQMTVTADDLRNQMTSSGFGNGYMYGLGQLRQMSLTADDLSRRMVARGFANMAEGQMTVAGDDASSHAVSRTYYTMPDNTNMMFVGQGDNSNHVVSNENGIHEGQMMVAMHDDRSAVMLTDGSNTAEGSVIMTKGDDVRSRVQNGHMMRQADDSTLMGAGGYSNVGEGQYYATGVETSGSMAVNDYSAMPEGNMLMTTVRDDSSRMMSGVYHQSLESPSMVVKGDDTMIVYRVD